MLTGTNLRIKRKIQKSEKDLKLYKSINDRSHLLCLKTGYIMQPSAPEIFQRKFMIQNLLIKNKSTQIFWKGIVDLRNLKAPLKDLIDLGQSYVQVYPKQEQKPMAGRQLNKTCFVTFGKFKHINKRRLKQICSKNQCQILAIDMVNKQFTVQIPHFTKYTFDEVDKNSEDQEQQIKISQIINKPQKKSDHLINSIRQTYAKNLSKQNQAIRAGSIGYPIQPKKYSLPTPKLESQIQKHNIKNGHMIQGNRIRGNPQTIGIKGRVKSQISTQNAHFILFNKLPQEKRDSLDIVLQMTKDNSKQIDYILSSKTKFQIKRALVLNMICFQFENCYFDFKRNGQKLQLVKISQQPEKHYQIKYFKSWFQWVLNQEIKLQEKENQIIKALVLRKGPQLAQKFLTFNQINNAEFLSSIEDQSYRLTEVPRNLDLILKAVSIGDMSYFNKFSWLVKLGVYVWYYSFKQFQNLSFKNILDQKIKNQPDYNIQRHILRLYISQPFLIQNLTYVPDEQSIMWWFILNKNNQKEKTINAANNFQYLRYRFSLLYSLTQTYANSQITLQLVSSQEFLKKAQKIKIFVDFINKFPIQAERVPINDWKEYADLINQNKAIIHFGNDEYFKALEYFSRSKTFTANGNAKIRQLAQKQEILHSFHTKTLLKCLGYLQKIRQSDCTYKLDNQIMFMRTALGKEILDRQNIFKILQFCLTFSVIQKRKRMLEVIFKQALKSRIIRSQLKKNDKIFNKRTDVPLGQKPMLQMSQKVTFYEALLAYYKDPQQILQLKFARLQL